MGKTEKLKIALDFIADYLCDDSEHLTNTNHEVKEPSVITENSDTFDNARKIMNTIEVNDAKKSAKAANDALKILSDEVNTLRAQNKTLKSINDKFTKDYSGDLTSKLGLTLDENNNIVSVAVKPLRSDSGEIEKTISNIEKNKIKRN